LPDCPAFSGGDSPPNLTPEPGLTLDPYILFLLGLGAVILLVGAGLKLDRPPGGRRWSTA